MAPVIGAWTNRASETATFLGRLERLHYSDRQANVRESVQIRNVFQRQLTCQYDVSDSSAVDPGRENMGGRGSKTLNWASR